MAKRVTVAFKVSEGTANDLRDAADRDERTVSAFVRKLVEGCPVKGPRPSAPARVGSVAEVESVSAICVDIRRAAEILGGVSPWTVRAWVANGDLPVVKLPGVRRGETSRRVLFAVSDLQEFVRRHREAAGG